MDMDRRDQQDGRMEQIYEQLQSAYPKFQLSQKLCKAAHKNHNENSCKDVHTNCTEARESIPDSEAVPQPGLIYLFQNTLKLSGIKIENYWLSYGFYFAVNEIAS